MTNKIITLLLLFFISSIILSSTLLAGKKKQIPVYNSSTVTTVNGTIKSVDIVTNKNQNEEGIHLKLQTKSKEIIVHVCPVWYAKKAEINFTKGEQLSVKGSTFTKDGLPNILAATISRDNSEILKLRDPESGKPLWKKKPNNPKKKKKP